MLNDFRQAQEAWEADDLPLVFDCINRAMQGPEAENPLMFELLGHALAKAGMPEAAAAAYEAAVTRDPAGGFVHMKQAIAAHISAGEEEKAFLAAFKAQKLVADDPDVVFVLVKGFRDRGEIALLNHFKNRLTASEDPAHLQLAAELISAETRNPFNLPLFRKLAAIHPDDHYTQLKLMAVAREFCDYPTVARQEAWLEAEIAAGREAVIEGQTHFANLVHCGDERLNRLAANNILIKGNPVPNARARRRVMPHVWGDRLRVGYFSNDFGSTHATMRLLRNVLELHDRSRFETTLYCYTSDDLIEKDDGGRRQWGPIVSVRDLDAAATAERMRSDGIDILVDLKGHTGNSRCHVLNQPIAPVHVGWLGFPGSTTGVDLDYVIGDRFVLPDSSKPHYHEKFLRMPHSYQPNDRGHRPVPPATSRAELGLPQEAFVFATFNSNRKITRQTLDLWAAIMQQVPGSVLWAMIYHDTARDNFRAYLAEKGIAGERVIFADAAPYDVHLARVQAADLCLDTFPYNGHTTTSDMLWAGLPVLTKRGTNFASRVSESLLNAVGLPELAATDSDDFVMMATHFASDRIKLAAARRKLVGVRETAPLFDPERFCRALESGFEKMAARARNGLEPDHIDLG